ncbi:purine-cytosine permease family protein [Gordonia sp. MP11Mi]|uniref:Cytosine permease n=1 Tax=Gordonia sp. MP11Mi TaxID=3022769 RepID=A0AA97GX52_9ACTN
MANASTTPAEDPTDSDFAHRPVPESARSSWLSVTGVTVGVMGAMVFLQVPGDLGLHGGVANTVIALVYAVVVAGVLATILAVVAAGHGINSNLISRGSGFGVAGSRITGLFYAANFIALAATEGSIMAGGLHEWIPAVPLKVWMVVLTVINIFLNWYGMALLERFQKYSLPVYIALLVLAIVWAANTSGSGHGAPSGLSGQSIVTAIGVLNGIVALQALLTADYARFIKKPTLAKCAAVGFAPQVGSFLIVGCIGIWFATRFDEPSPGVYLVMVMGGWGALYTVVSQIRINLINIYSGSLSLQATAASTGKYARGIWVSITAVIALAAMLGNVLGHLGDVLTFLGAFMFAWVSILFADILFARTWRLGAAADDWSASTERFDVGTGIALVAGATVGGVLAIGVDNWLLNAISAFVAGGVAFVLHTVSAWLQRGRLDAGTTPAHDPVNVNQ